MRIGRAAAPGKLQHHHAGRPDGFPQLIHICRDHAKVLCYDWNMPQLLQAATAHISHVPWKGAFKMAAQGNCTIVLGEPMTIRSSIMSAVITLRSSAMIGTWPNTCTRTSNLPRSYSGPLLCLSHAPAPANSHVCITFVACHSRTHMEAFPTLSNAAKSSVPGPFFHVPFMAVSSFASTAQYPVHQPTHDPKNFPCHAILSLNERPAFIHASPLQRLLPVQKRRTHCRMYAVP